MNDTCGDLWPRCHCSFRRRSGFRHPQPCWHRGDVAPDAATQSAQAVPLFFRSYSEIPWITPTLVDKVLPAQSNLISNSHSSYLKAISVVRHMQVRLTPG